MGMRQVTLTRTDSDDQGTVGYWALPDLTLACLELPWRDNAPSVSCIPPGEYDVVWTRSTRFDQMMYEILNVPDRTGVRIHGGTFAGDKSLGFKSHSDGCPLTGISHTRINGQRAVTEGLRARQLFDATLRKKPFRLRIVEQFAASR